MKAGRLLLCMLLSVAMIVTFIPVFSFATPSDSAHQFNINNANIEGISANDDGWYCVPLENGVVWTPNYDTDEECFYAEAGEAVFMNIVPDDGYCLDYVYYEEIDADDEPIVDDFAWSESEECYYFTMPNCDQGKKVTVYIGFTDDVFDEDAEATLVLVDDRKLVFDFTDEEYTEFQEGDQIIITYSKGDEVTFEYGKHGKDGYGFYCGNEELELHYWPIAGERTQNLNAFYYGDELMQFEIDFSVPAEVITDVKSISFAPKTVTLFSEDIKEGDSDEGYYSLDQRHKFTYHGDTYTSSFDEGDSITVNYLDGSSKVYMYKSIFTTGSGPEFDSFVNGRNTLNPDICKINGGNYFDLFPGNNTVTIYYHGAITTFNVFVDTPALRAQRAEAARQGTLDAKMPAAKISKPKAAKKAITVKWKKLKKKQLKKVAKIEVWVSTNKSFPRGATVEKFVSKKKASVKIKGLKKKTKYFVKVRAIKNVNGKKVVGKWSKVKKVKTK